MTTPIEKFVLGMIVSLIIVMGLLSWKLVTTVEEAGGVKQVIIDTGKEFKDISKQINEK